MRAKREENMKDLTVGKPFEVIGKFALPMILSMIFQQVYSVVDSIVAGRFIGVNALGAVGASQPITVIFSHRGGDRHGN